MKKLEPAVDSLPCLTLADLRCKHAVLQQEHARQTRDYQCLEDENKCLRAQLALGVVGWGDELRWGWVSDQRSRPVLVSGGLPASVAGVRVGILAGGLVGRHVVGNLVLLLLQVI